MTTTHDALDAAMQQPTVDDAISTLIQRGVWMADTDTMSEAIHRSTAGSWPTTTIPTTRIASRPAS